MDYREPSKKINGNKNTPKKGEEEEKWEIEKEKGDIKNSNGEETDWRADKRE